MNPPIIVGIDLLESSQIALEAAVPIARTRDAEIILVHVTELPESAEVFDWSPYPLVQRFRATLTSDLAAARKELENIRIRYQAKGVRISNSLVSGSAYRGILEAADKHKAGLIIIGSHGRTGLARWLVGSVAERVSRHASCDVLVARKQWGERETHRILVPTDFSEHSSRALEVATQLAGDSELTLLHCFEVPASVEGMFAHEMTLEIESAYRKKLKAIAEPLRNTGRAVRTVVRAGNPPSWIIEFAALHELVVMGNHGRHGLERFLLGSVAEKTVRRAPCSVYLSRGAGLSKPKGGTFDE